MGNTFVPSLREPLPTAPPPSPAHHWQIAKDQPSLEIAGHLRSPTRDRHIRIRLGGLLTLAVGDTGPIWRSHNDSRSADFEALFALLARYPGQPMRFVCEIVQ